MKIIRWWLNKDRKYGLWWRLGNGFAAVLMLSAVVIPVAQDLLQNNQYHLSADALKLVGSTDSSLTKQLTYDSSTSTYQFNKSAITSDDTSTNPLTAMQTQVGTASGTDSDKSLYALDVPTDFSKGVTYHDTNSELSFSLIPQFKADSAKDVDGHLVFPLAGSNQAVYTLKNNGLKEDIVVPKTTQDSMAFSYTLNLPKTLEAKVIPDSNGAIGIYSGDPALFGDMSYGSDTDKQAVETAREKADKTYLVFGLPSPVIKDTSGNEVGSARFKLSGNQLMVVATGLSQAKSAVTIDPSVVITSTSDFQTNGNNEDNNIDFTTTSGQINRGSLTGGSINAGWTVNSDTGATLASNHAQQIIAYNGYIYIIDGFANSGTAYAVYAPINSSGSLGTWTTTSLPNYGREGGGMVAYNGYLYLYGGYNEASASILSSVESAAVKSDGSLGTWTTSSNTMTYGVCRFGYAAYNGYLYATGGNNVNSGSCGNASTPTNYVQYAALNANGTTGSWSSTTAFTTTRMGHSTVAYNGYLYVFGGNSTNLSTLYSDVQYAQLNANGTVGSWITTTAMSTGRTFASAVVTNGYIYYVAGYESGAASVTTVYASLNANGTIGKWQSTSVIANSRYDNAVTAYNGYIYTNGGTDGTNTFSNTQYAKIDSAGMLGVVTAASNTYSTSRESAAATTYNGYLYYLGGYGSSSNQYLNYAQFGPLSTSGNITTAWTTGNAFTNARADLDAVAYNGYLYILGGFNGNTSTYYNDVQYASLNASTGVIGTWATTTAFDTTANARGGISAFVYNGYMYVTGGYNASGNFSSIRYAPINSDGTIGTWNSMATSMPVAMNRHRALVYGNYVYLVGGTQLALPTWNNGQTSGSRTTGAGYSAVYVASINGSTGVIGSWTSTTAMPISKYEFAAGIIDGYIYTVGGFNTTSTSGVLQNQQYAPINSDGTVGTWLSGKTTVGRASNSGAVANGYMYDLGGATDTTDSSTSRNSLTSDLVDYTGVNNGGNGVAGTWITNSTDMSGAFPNGFSYGQTFAYNGYIYAVGGYDSTGTRLATVWSAPINANGSLGSWTQQSSMQTARQSFVLEIYNGYVYVYTGVNNSAADVNTSEYAKIGSAGTLGTWTSDATMNLSSGSVPIRNSASGAVYNGYLYLFGGYHSSTYYSDSYYAPINSDGSIGTWVSSTAFTTARLGASSFAYKGNVYIIGGRTTTSGTYLSDVQYAPLTASTGAVGTWQYTTALLQARAYNALSFANGYVYIYGGTNSVGGLVDIEQAPILANGSIGTWEKSISSSFTNARSYPTGVIYNGYVYQLGGYASSGPVFYKDVQYAPLNAMARVSHYSKLIDLGAPTNMTSIVTNGSLPGGSTSVSYRTAGSNGIFGTSASAANLSGSGSCIGNAVGTRYVFISVTLDDSTGLSSGGTYPDTIGTPANVTDVTVNYNTIHPATNIRLRTGQTLQSGNVSALDTCAS